MEDKTPARENRNPSLEKRSAPDASPSARRNRAIVFFPFFLFLVGNGILYLQFHMRPRFSVIKTAYDFNTLAFPLILCLAGAYGSRDWIRNGMEGKRPAATIVLCLLAFLCVGARVYATYFEPRRLVLRKVTIDTPKVDRPIRILHVSDIQSDAVGSFEERVFARMRELEPDIIFHTGDLLHPIRPATVESEHPKLAALFRTLNPPGGLFGVYGNMDVWSHALSTGDLGGLRMLESREATVEVGDLRVRVFGLSNDQSRGLDACRETVEKWLASTEPGDFTILLGHYPDYVLDIQDLPVDLCLAGHTHGGQIRIPFYGPIPTLSRVPRDWSRGYREVGQTRLNVSAGIGNEHSDDLPAIRVNCPPEMSSIELR